MADKPIIQEYIGSSRVHKTQDSNKWWDAPTAEVHERLIPYIQRLRQNQSVRRTQNVRFAKLYQNQALTGTNRFTDNFDDTPTASSMSYNVIKSGIDTAVAKIAKQRPRAYFLTEKGNSAQQKRAKLLTQYMDGTFHDMNIYSLGAKVVRDATIIGLGALKIYKDTERGKICAERVVTDELTIDDNEGMYGEPGQLHQVKYIFKDVLVSMYPKYTKEINDAKPAFDDKYTDTEAREMVLVVESWKLRASPTTSGKHAITIDGATLLDEPYDKDYYPFVFFRWTERITGFWGMGIAEELYGTQLEINKLLRTVQLAQHFIAVPRVMVNAATKVNTTSISNKVGSIVKYAGPEPKFVTAQAMSSEIYNYIRWLIQSSFEQIGISQLSATSQKPAGLDSGAALREYQDIETERFALVSQAYERFYLDVAKIVLDLSKELYTDNNIPMKYAGKDFIKKIKWKDVSMDEDQYVMQIYPTNILPTLPAAKLQKASELYQGGIIDKATFTRLTDFPDLKEAMDPLTASDDLIIYMLDDIVEEGKYQPPEPALNLDRATQLSNLRFLTEKRNNLSDDRLELLMRWHKKALELSNAANPPPPVMEAPMAVPEALPTSDLLPQVPQI